MMNEFIVKVEKSTRMVDLPKNVIGNDMENLQEKLIFKFTDEFVNGQARLEYKIGSTKNYIVLSKENDNYTMPLKNVLTKEGKIEMQLVITETSETEEIPVFKSNVFYLYCNKSINAVNEAPDGYELWIETANAKLNLMDEALAEVDNLDIDANKVETTTTIEITKKDGTIKEVQIFDGEQGEQGIPGQDGYTPQKGIDYFTPEDIESLNIPTKLSELTDDLGSSPVHTHSQYLTEHQDISMKQNIEDNTLNTNNKTVPSAINEVNSIAKGANQALSYSNYQSMINVFNNLANNVYNVGQNVMIVTLQVPDLWISGIESTSSTYTYTTDSAFTTELSTNGYVQVGYYKLSALETQKVDLTNYVQFTNYARSSKAGVIKSANYLNVSDSGIPYVSALQYNTYLTRDNTIFISKGTLENVVAGKNLETANNKVTSISSSSTDTQYPSAKCVYDIVGDIDSVIDAINGEVI